MHAFPAILPLRLRKKAPEHFAVQRALAPEIAVKPAMRQPRAFHDLADGNSVEPISIEQSSRAFHDLLPHRRPVARRISHKKSPPFESAKVCLAIFLLSKYVFEHIFVSCFHALAAGAPQP